MAVGALPSMEPCTGWGWDDDDEEADDLAFQIIYAAALDEAGEPHSIDAKADHEDQTAQQLMATSRSKASFAAAQRSSSCHSNE